MKRYMLFTFDSYYPAGGANDMVGCFDTLLSCVRAVKKHHAHMLDVTTMKIIHMPTNLNGDQLFKWARDLDRANRLNKVI